MKEGRKGLRHRRRCTHVAPPMDRDALVARCMGNLEFAQKMLTDFEGYLPERVDQIVRVLGQHDAGAAADLAHGLKGTAGIMTAKTLQAVAAGIEAAGMAGDLAEATPLSDRLNAEARRCLDYIPELRTRTIG